jgi:hypothetical protein
VYGGEIFFSRLKAHDTTADAPQCHPPVPPRVVRDAAAELRVGCARMPVGSHSLGQADNPLEHQRVVDARVAGS